MKTALQSIALAAALIATPAFADPPEEELTAAPGSIAYGMIEEAEAQDFFDIVHNGQVSVRHLTSRLRCDFDREGEGGRIILLGGAPRGDNVACSMVDARESITLYATRYPDERDLDRATEGAESAIRRRFADAQPYPVTATSEDAALPARRVRHFVIVVDGRRQFTSLALAQANGWTYMVRYTTVAADENLSEYEPMASQLLTGILLELDDTP